MLDLVHKAPALTETLRLLTGAPEAGQTHGAKRSSKGEKVPIRLEFEQKYLLDPRRCNEILDELCETRREPNEPISLSKFANPKPGNSLCVIRQFYDNGDRYRHTGDIWSFRKHVSGPKFIKEKKKSIYMDTEFSVNSEEEETIKQPEFEAGWLVSKRRLQKIRFYIQPERPDHRTVVDFFYTMHNRDPDRPYIYAVMAEDEAMLDNTTVDLYLRFEIPIYLDKYLLSMVDSRDQAMKSFRSAYMIDTPEAIADFEKAISQWYGDSA